MKYRAALASFAFALFLFIIPQTSTATPLPGLASTTDLGGFAWSSTIGWISMHCGNTSNCAADGGIDYGVSFNQNGNMTGYAWSPNIGWINFTGLGLYPVAPGNIQNDAVLRHDAASNTYYFEGWARACAGTTDPSNCVGALASRSDGWDGWLSLRGTNHSVVFNASGTVSSAPTEHWAWGGPVVGWVDFLGVQFGVVPVTVPTTTPTGLTITSVIAAPNEVTFGNTTTITYGVTGATSCTASNNNGDPIWSGPVPSSDGSHSVTVTPPLGTTDYQLDCTNGVTSVTDSAPVTARPDISVGAFSAVPGTVDISGLYDFVNFNVAVSSIPAAVGSVNYRLTFGSLTTTGTLSNGSTAITLNNVPFNTTGPAIIEVDAPFPGAVIENLSSTPVDEDDNTGTVSPTLSPPPPRMELIVVNNRDFVRRGGDIGLNWIVEAPYDLACELRGPGVSQSINLTGGVPGAPALLDQVTPVTNLQNSATFVLRCGADEVSRSVEVIPDYQEI